MAGSVVMQQRKKLSTVFTSIERNFCTASIWYSYYVTHWTSEDSGFDSRQGNKFCQFSIISRQALGPTQPPVQWVPECFFPGIQAYYSTSLIAQDNNGGALPPLTHTSSCPGV